jgi:exopolyphosphatase/guanosine-5'-triphosphate,3'-diphosphate pyrophosphatase
MPNSNSIRRKQADQTEYRTVAVVDIGATSIRMAVAEIHAVTQSIRIVETLSQPVALGKDTFQNRRISKSSIEECVRVLRGYQRVLKEFGVVASDQMRIVATSAVREANNRLTFLDRIYIATQLDVEILEEAEVNRITYMGIQPLIQGDPRLSSSKTVIVEVGSGSTEVLMVRGGNVLFSNNYRLGSLRLLETLDKLDTPQSQFSNILANQVQRFADQIYEQIDTSTSMEMIAIGGDMRFCVRELLGNNEQVALVSLSIDELETFTHQLISLNTDQVAQKYSIAFHDAETVAPALLCYLMLAKRLGCKTIRIANTNLRDGLIQDLAMRDAWTAEFRNQIVRSAITLGRKFGFQETHALHVAMLSRKLFEDLQSEHQLDARYELIVYLAAMLHEIGLFINVRSNHKHAMYLIRNSDLFGLNKSDTLLVALVARYHRRASPQASHEAFSTLDRTDRVVVCKLASILRVAIALDESRSQRITNVTCRREKNRFVISAHGVDDVTVEKLSLRQSTGLFEETFGARILLRARDGS